MTKEMRPADLARAVQGDMEAFSLLLAQPHQAIQASRDALDELVLTADSVRRVLVAFQQHAVDPSLVQRWASFVRWGMIAGNGDEPIKSIDIDYDTAAAEKIADVIVRLDEIGDSIDGEISKEDLREMIHSLTD